MRKGYDDGSCQLSDIVIDIAMKRRLTRTKYACPNRRLTENVFKPISAILNPNSKPNPPLTLNPNPKAQKRRKNENVIFRANVQIPCD